LVRHNPLFVRALALTAILIGGRLPAQDPVLAAASRAASAQLRPGDRIDFQFRQEGDLNGATVVNERGEAVFPKLGTIRVSDITIGSLQDTLRARYSEYLRNPEMEVSVLRRVTVNGEVRQPNVYMLDVTSTVRDAIAKAGGLLETSNKSKVYVVRSGQRLKVRDWEHETGPEADLLSGDEVIVGRKSWLTLNALSVISTSVIVIGLIQSLRH